jgi:hypothetical protein
MFFDILRFFYYQYYHALEDILFMVDDKEIGKASDIVEVLYAG